MNKLSYSVVMTTFNGEKYIREQLDSIRGQKRKPNEVIILDDCSTDSTVAIITDYLSQYAEECKDYKILKNEINIGWRKNFVKGFKLATQDVIFCCDQDDIWYEDKCDKMLSVLEYNNEINVLACNLNPVYLEGGQKLQTYNVSNYGNDLISQLKLDHRWMMVLRQGCSMCFRRSFLPKFELIWYEKCAHDAALWAVGTACGGAYIYNEMLMDFRRHSGNNTPINKRTTSSKCSGIKKDLIICNRIIEHSDELGIPDNNLNYIMKYSKFLSDRLCFMKNHRIAEAFILLLKVNYFPKKKSFLADIYSILRSEK